MIYLCYGDYQGRTVKGFYKYVFAKAKKADEDISCKTYITDVLSYIAEKIGIQVNYRWFDLAFGEIEKQEESENQAKEEFYNFFGGGDGD